MLHLIHPALVHFTVAFLVAGGLAEALGILARRPGLERFGSVMVVVGVLSLLPTVVSGFLAENTLTVPDHAVDDLELHERLGLTVLAVFILVQFWRGWFGGRVPDGHRVAYAVALLVGVGLVVTGALFGGHLVYDHALGVDVIGSGTGP